MPSVDPYIFPIPEHFLNHPDQEVRDWFRYDNRFKHDLWLRTGGPTDAIEGGADTAISVDTQSAQIRAQVSSLIDRVEQLEANREISITPPVNIKDFNQILVTAVYTAHDKDFISVQTSETVYLPLYPDANAVIIASNGHSSSITIDGNGRTINGTDQVRSSEKYTTIIFYYFQPSDEWLMTVQTVEDTAHKLEIKELTESIRDALLIIKQHNEIITDECIKRRDIEYGDFR